MMRTRTTIPRSVIADVEQRVRRLCEDLAAKLQFHGWHHVSFVRDKAVHFAGRNGAAADVVEVAALVHDLNYMVRRNSLPTDGEALRRKVLFVSGVCIGDIEWVERIVVEAEMRTRHRDISLEAQALSDADTLFKALPVTPVVLAHKIVGEQVGKADDGYYFYDAGAAATYTKWAEANLSLWRCIVESLDDPCVEDLLTHVAV